MQAFFCPEQLRHAPQHIMRLGRLRAPDDVAARAETLCQVLINRGIPLATPPDVGRAPLTAIHSAAYLDYLEHAWSRWQTLAAEGLDPGPEVLPNLSPYYSGQIHTTERDPCPASAMAAQTGYYLGDLSCPIGPHTWRAALRATHTAVAAAEHVIAGGGPAYALCRPSGHHAHRDRAVGFCYLNNSAAAAQTLVKDGFEVMVYTSDDPIIARELEQIGCVAVMPLAAPIGSGLGIQNKYNLLEIIENAKVPIIVDAGVGTASDAAIAMELGCDGVLMNTAIAGAREPVRMARAMRLAVEAGREAFLAGRIPRKRYASASSPVEGLVG